VGGGGGLYSKRTIKESSFHGENFALKNREGKRGTGGRKIKIYRSCDQTLTKSQGTKHESISRGFGGS